MAGGDTFAAASQHSHLARPDVASLQELKATDSEFPVAGMEKAGYGAVWRGQKSWNGVGILARGGEPVVTRAALPGDSDGRTRNHNRHECTCLTVVGVCNARVANANPALIGGVNGTLPEK